PVAILSFDVVVDPADVRVVELREKPRLTEEASLRFRLQALFGTDCLECNPPFQRLVEPGVDLTHPSCAKGMEHAVMRDKSIQRSASLGMSWGGVTISPFLCLRAGNYDQDPEHGG